MAGGEKRAFSSSSASSSSSALSVSSLALREAFFNSLKEASCAATGSAARVLAIPGAAAERIWAAAEAGDAEAASAAVSRVLRSGEGSVEGGDEGGVGGPLPSSSGFIPLRLAVVAPAAGESLRDPHCTFEVVCTSRPVAKSSSSGSSRGGGEDGGKEETRTAATAAAATTTAATATLGEALLEALPKLPGGGGGERDPDSPAWTLDPSSLGSGLLLRGKSARVLVAGLDVAAASAAEAAAEAAEASASAAGSLRPPPLPVLAAPLPWVHARLSACDQFLYVVVRAPEPL